MEAIRVQQAMILKGEYDFILLDFSVLDLVLVKYFTPVCILLIIPLYHSKNQQWQQVTGAFQQRAV